MSRNAPPASRAGGIPSAHPVSAPPYSPTKVPALGGCPGCRALPVVELKKWTSVTPRRWPWPLGRWMAAERAGWVRRGIAAVKAARQGRGAFQNNSTAFSAQLQLHSSRRCVAVCACDGYHHRSHALHVVIRTIIFPIVEIICQVPMWTVLATSHNAI